MVLTFLGSSSVIEYTGSGIFLIFFYAVSVVLLVFAPSQDEHHIDLFHRHYVKQSKRKLLQEHVRVKNPQQAFNHPKGHSIGLRIEWSMLSQTTSAFEEQGLYFLKQGGM